MLTKVPKWGPMWEQCIRLPQFDYDDDDDGDVNDDSGSCKSLRTCRQDPWAKSDHHQLAAPIAPVEHCTTQDCTAPTVQCSVPKLYF